MEFSQAERLFKLTTNLEDFNQKEDLIKAISNWNSTN